MIFNSKKQIKSRVSVSRLAIEIIVGKRSLWRLSPHPFTKIIAMTNKNKTYRSNQILTAGLTLSLLGGLAQAESPWEVTGAAGAALSKGNADNLSFTLQLLSTYEQGDTEGLIGADWLYSESDGVKSTDSFRAFGEYQRLFSERFYLGANSSYLVDSINEIDYRVDVGVTAGYYLLKSDPTKLSFEAGPGYAWQNKGGVSRDFMTLRLAQRLEYKLSQSSKLWQSATYVPEVDDLSSNIFSVEVGVDTTISSHWALRASARYSYDSSPALGRQSDDTLLTVGLRYALGGFSDSAPEGRKTLKPEDAPAATISMGWASSAALGIALAEGNSDNLNVNAVFDTAYREKQQEFFFNGSYTYSENSGVKSSNILELRTQYNRLLNERWYVGFGAGFLSNDLADVDYRITPATTLGYYLIKSDRVTLSVEAGPGYTFEEVGGVSDDFFSIAGAEKFVWKLNDRMSLKQSVVGLINPSESDDYMLTADVYLDTEITKNLAWRISASWIYDNTPAASSGKDDTTLTTGIAVRF